jgi:nucleoside-diphosphate-sugar epimerase
MKCCFIGSNGFLSTSFGKYFCDKEGFSIDVFGKEPPKFYTYSNFYAIDFTQNVQTDILLEYDIIFYLIGKGIQNKKNVQTEEIYLTNVFTPINIIIGLNEKKYKGTFVTFGSYFEIGNNVEIKKFGETDIIFSTLSVPTDYCKSKRLLSRFIDSADYNFKTWHFILPTIYGENENQERLIPYVIKAIKNDTVINLTSAEQIREYIYVDEIPKILHYCINHNISKGCYNISGTEIMTIKELVLEIMKYFNFPENKILFGTEIRTDIQMRYLMLNGEKLQSLISYKPQLKIINQIKKYLDEL